MWIPDPANNRQPSVTLTGLVISFLFVIGFSIAYIFGAVEKEPGPLMELLWTCAALYLGRRLSFNGKSFGGGENTASNTQEGNQ